MITLQDFLWDVRDHVLTIELDQGVHRCLLLGRPGSSAYHYRLVTYPGGLLINGDMGDYSFSRTRDMFGFFRDSEMTNKINPGYWHQKLRACEKTSPPKVFSEDKFKAAVNLDIEDWEVRLGDAEKIREEVHDGLLSRGISHTQEAYEAVRDFEASDGNHFQDFEADLRDWDHHFPWALRAIVWGIKQYDLVKEGRTQADHDRKVLGYTAM